MKKAHALPFMSVVVISYNSASQASRALESLLAQDYPKDKFEIIFVNDGSVDNTRDIVAQYPTVRYIELPTNRGISAARNAGLSEARGDIYVSFDADCVASPDWLTRLSEGYRLFNPAGVGGTVVELRPIEGLVQSYIHVTGRGMTRNVRPSRLLPPFDRLWAYIVSNAAKSVEIPEQDHSKVSELYGANCSFPIDVLRSVNGWEATMNGIEDRDLSLRIRKRFPKKYFYAMHNAKIMHDPAISFTAYLLRPFRRGPANYMFHASNAMTPPLFPFPFFMVGLFAAGLVINPWLLLPVLLVAPQFLYFWWPYRAVREVKPSYLAFAYMQLAEEIMVLCGLLRGYILHRGKAYAKH